MSNESKAIKLKWKFNYDQKNSRHSEDPDVHIEFTAFGYETLCGLGSEGVSRNNDNYLETTNRKVTCNQCLLIYNFCNGTKI